MVSEVTTRTRCICFLRRCLRFDRFKTSELGELIMNRLRRYDKVAYVRFASVYLDFKDVKEFMNELKDLVKAKAQ